MESISEILRSFESVLTSPVTKVKHCSNNMGSEILLLHFKKAFSVNPNWATGTNSAVSFCNILNAPADCTVKKTLESGFQTILHSIPRLLTEYWHDVSELKKMGPKNQKKMSAVFPVFVYGPFIPLVSTLGKAVPACFETC